MTANADTNYERERRFLVAVPSVVEGWPWVLITQAYLWSSGGYAVRVRLVQRQNSDGTLSDLDATYALKGPRVGDERFELEVSIPDFSIAEEIVARAAHVVRKRRYQVVDTESYDVDVFLDENEGLVIAELEGTDVRGVRRPEWCSREITTEDRYNNEELAFNPLRSARPSEGEWP